jgi:spore cortex formation protein SpoVR/YcgB (stage V sporulation)
MKQKDVALIIVIVFVSGVASFFLSNYFFASSTDRQQKVEVVEAISPAFQDPNKKYFNNTSIDPTQLIQIGTSTNPNPFNGAPSQ